MTEQIPTPVFRAWLNHANFSCESFAWLAGEHPLTVIDWINGKRTVPQWAITICRLADCLRSEAKIVDVLDYLAGEPGLEPHEILGLFPTQLDDLHVEAAVEGLEDRFGPSETIRQAAAEWRIIRG